MLNAAKSAATEKGVGGKAKAGEGGRDVRKSGRIGVGDRVEGRFEAGAEWFPAVVTKVKGLRAKGRAAVRSKRQIADVATGAVHPPELRSHL